LEEAATAFSILPAFSLVSEAFIEACLDILLKALFPFIPKEN
jgi:hypothetical protein